MGRFLVIYIKQGISGTYKLYDHLNYHVLLLVLSLPIRKMCSRSRGLLLSLCCPFYRCMDFMPFGGTCFMCFPSVAYISESMHVVIKHGNGWALSLSHWHHLAAFSYQERSHLSLITRSLPSLSLPRWLSDCHLCCFRLEVCERWHPFAALPFLAPLA